MQVILKLVYTYGKILTTPILLYLSNDILKCHLYDLGSKVIQMVLLIVSC